MRPLFLAQDVNGLPVSTARMSQMQIVWGCHEELSPPTYMAYTTICTSRRGLSLPVGKGGFKTVGLYIDTYSNFIWWTKLKTTGSRKSMIASLKRIFYKYRVPKSFMYDIGSHFKNNKVDEFCKEE